MTTLKPQGEHAQTEALRLADDLEASSLFPGNMRSCNNAAAAELRRLHAQVTELTAALGVQAYPVKDEATCQMCGEKPYPGCNSEFQDEAACRFYHPAPAQPAAPQGVAYAELPDEHAAFETWARLRSDWRPNLERKGDGYVGAFADEAWRGWSARASNGQAPAASPWKDHQTREIVNQLRDCAKEYHATQQLRERLLDVLGPMIDWVRAVQAPTTAQAAPAAGAVAGPTDATRNAWQQGYAQGVVSALPSKVTPDMRRVFREGYREGGFWSDRLDYALEKMLAAAPTPAAQADSQPAPQGETNVQLDTDSNPSAPGQHRDMAGSVALGQPMGHGQDQAAGHSGAQGDKLLTVAERNIRSFLRSAIFKSESDREAALSCVDVLRDAARAQADSVLEDAALLDWQASARVEVSPEYEGPWHAAAFGEDEKPVFLASGNTPREALIAARKQGAKHD